jgi:N-acetylmuramoyl-L-alanine amidase
MRRSPRYPALRLALLGLVCLLPLIAPGQRIRDIRVADQAGFVRCVIELDGPATFRTRNASARESTVSIEIAGITGVPADDIRNLTTSRLVTDQVLSFHPERTTAYVHLHVERPVRIESQRLSAPDRLVFDLFEGDEAPAAEAPAPLRLSDAPAPAAPTPRPAATPAPLPPVRPGAFRPRIVVVDAGHGGSHRGGYGYLRAERGERGAEMLPRTFQSSYGFAYGRKVDEASATLPIALRLERLLAADPLLEPRLTRRHDEYLGLRERTRRAEQFGGEYFISIHYNAVPESTPKTARGLEFFTWSPKEADSVALRYLQQLDNEEGPGSDISAAGRGAREVLNQMMIDALEEQAIESRAAARSLENAFLRDPYFKRHYRGIKSARFKVLENYNMPSVLIEVGFISHPEEARLAMDSAFQDKVARLLYEGIVAYFEATDPAFRAARSRQLAGR